MLRLLPELSQVPTSLLPRASRWSPTQPHCHENAWQPHWQASPPFGKGYHGDSVVPPPLQAGAALPCATDTSSALGWGWARVTRTFTGSLHLPQAGYGQDAPGPSPPRASQVPQRGRGGRFVPSPGHHIIGNTWDRRLRWCLCCRASPPGWTLMDGTGRTRAKSQRLQLRRFELDMAENLVSRRVVQPWDRYPQGGGISILGGCQVSFDKAMAYCWASSEWDTGLDTSKDPFPPTLLRSLARIDPEKSCPAPTPSCFSKVCWFLGQATG